MIRQHMVQSVLLAALLLTAACQPGGPDPVLDARSATGLAYDLLGQGPLVVLIHGTNLDRRMWDGEIAWLQNDARVLRYDLRGQGVSAAPSEPFSNHNDLITLLDELGEEEVSLLGLSAGAQVALDMALEVPHRVKRIVLASPSLSGYVPAAMPPFFEDLSSALRAEDYDRANEILLASPILRVPDEFTESVRTMVEENTRLWTLPYSLIEQVTPPAIQRLETIRTPTLILDGKNDLEAIQAQSQILEEQLPDVRRVAIPGGEHLLNMSSPDAFREAVHSFLNE